MISKSIIAALAIAVATPAVAQPPYQPHSDWYSPGYGEHRRWTPEERYDRMLERERIERERAAERERHRIRCAHNPYSPSCYR